MATILSRYKGSLVGGVVGDCIGAVFENCWNGPIALQRVLTEGIQKIEKDAGTNDSKKPKIMWEFTDDTAMARSVIKSLIKCNGFHARDMAERFTNEYHAESGRGYGGSVVSVFCQLKENGCTDIFGPAAKQFDGEGSFGNGGSMRISPAALFAHNKQMDFANLKEMVEGITKLTHTHIGAIHGAILQAYAVHLALNTSQLNVEEYIDELKAKMKILEDEHKASKESKADNDTSTAENGSEVTGSDTVTDNEKTEDSYCSKLEKIKKFVLQDEEPPPELIEEQLGTGIAAFEAVPAAIYSFLRAMKDIKGIEDRNPFERTVIYAITLGGDTDTIATMVGAMAGAYITFLKDRNPFERTVIYAITLGGDTDTIATMAGAIAGAYYGVETIPSAWCRCCEGAYEAMNDAELLTKLET